jgi:hypothetical protein
LRGKGWDEREGRGIVLSSHALIVLNIAMIQSRCIQLNKYIPAICVDKERRRRRRRRGRRERRGRI